MDHTAPKRVLIADDDPAVRAMLRDHLELDGYKVREAACGRDVLGLVRKWQPDVVLLDLLMIPVDGLEVLWELQTAGLVPGVPVIVISAFLSSPDQAKLQEEMQARGARAWMGKPITDFERLRALIDHPPELLNAPWNGEEP